MQKIVKFLETYCEWIAVTIAVLYLGWMAYAYLIAKPVSTTLMISGQAPLEVWPGNVDEQINGTVYQRLEQAMANPTVPTFEVGDFKQDLQNKINIQDSKPEPLQVSYWDFQPVPGLDLNGPAVGSNGPGVSELPSLPAPIPLLVSGGLSTIIHPTATDTNHHEDIQWASIACYIPSQAFFDAWKKAFGPSKPGMPWKLSNSTEFLQVTAYRQEVLPNGQLSNPVEVKRMWNDEVQPYPANGDKNAQGAYNIWASQNAPLIVTPPFPGQPPAPAGAIFPTDPATWTGLPAAGTQAPAPPPGAGGPQPAPAPAPAPVPVATGTTPAPGGMDIITVLSKTQPQVAPAAVANTFKPDSFVPGTADLLVYAIDTDVKPGHTYKYSIKYTIYNPLFNGIDQQAPGHPQWLAQLGLESPISALSPEFKVPAKTYFYCNQTDFANNNTNPYQPFAFDVFTWANGLWQEHVFKEYPGDLIGGVVTADSGDIDFSTEMTYVDGHKRQTGKVLVTVMDSDGIAKTRDADADANSQDHQDKKNIIAQQAAAPTNTSTPTPTPTPGGTNPPPPPPPPPGGAGQGGGPPPGPRRDR